MSIEDVKKVLDKAHNDESFRKSLIEDPESALKDFSLSDQEKEKFKNIGSEKLASYKSNLDKRFSKDGSGDNDWWVESVTD